MATEGFVRGPVDREDSIAKTSLSNNYSLRVLGMSPGSFVWLYNPSPCRDLHYITLHYINSVFIFVLGVYYSVSSLVVIVGF